MVIRICTTSLMRGQPEDPEDVVAVEVLGGTPNYRKSLG